MTNADVSPNPYRWIILLNYAFIQAIMQILWITFAPITGNAAEFYGVSALQIGFLAMSFMVVYIFISFPASWAIDTFGIRKGVGFGVVLISVFGILRGVMGSDYTYVMLSMIGLAIAQPFILNSVTSLSAKWFPLHERATAAGIAFMAQFVGIMIGMVATPFLTIQFGIPGMLTIYGVVTIAGAVCFFLFVKPAPVQIKEEAAAPRTKVFEGLRHLLKLKDMILMIIMIFIGLGIFNAITTWIEQMIAPRGFSIVQAGTLGAVLMAGGIVGCLVVPTLSDRLRKRRLPVVVCLIGSLPGLIGLTFVSSFGWLLASGVCMGFFLMGMAPVLFQYGTEVSYPAPEATSQGVLMFSGQISGIIFIFSMDMFRTESGSMTPFLLVMIGLWALNIILSFFLKESSIIEASGEGSAE